MVTGALKPINNDSYFSLMKARYMMIHKRGSFNEKCIKRNKRGHIVKHEGTTKTKKDLDGECGSFKEFKKLLRFKSFPYKPD